MALYLSQFGGPPVKLGSDWQPVDLGEGAPACRIRTNGSRGAQLEHVGAEGSAAIVVELRAGAIWQAMELQPGKSSALGPGSRFFLKGRQEATLHKLEAMAYGEGEGPGSPAAAAAAAGSGAAAEPSSGGGKRAAAAGCSAGSMEDAAKRQRLASGAAAGPSGAVVDPLDRVPDTPMHLMAVRGIPDWANQGFLGLRLADLVRGDMLWVLASNYMMDFRWLLSACPDLARAGRLVLVHGEHAGSIATQNLSRDVSSAGLAARTSIHAPPLPIQFGTHHSKAFLIEYPRGLRVIVFTANDIYPDCNNKSQGLFWQDFPPKDGQSPQASPFQEELEAYVRELRLPLPEARKALGLLAAHDFSAARAHLVASVPGYHKGAAMHKWGHLRLRALLNREPPFPAAFQGAPIAAQFSSLGSLDEAWLLDEFRASLAAGRCGDGSVRLGAPAAGPAGLQLVWTTVEEVQNSLEGWFAGRSIPGPEKNVSKPFLQRYWHKWGGEACGRQRAAPHIKSYCRWRAAGEGADAADIAWLYVGSHNLSKAAWGALQKKGTQLMIRSYELGVLLVPSLEAAYRSSRWRGFSCTSSAALPAAAEAAPAAAAAAGPAAAAAAAAAAGPAAAALAAEQGAAPGAADGAAVGPSPVVRFAAWQRGQSQEAAAVDGTLSVPLPLPYSLPPRRYGSGDRPWMVDGSFPGVDSLGRRQDSAYGVHYGLLEGMSWGEF